MTTVPPLADLLSQLVVDAAARAGHDGILDNVEPATPTNNAKFGDYQSNHAFRLGKAMRTNPRKVADAVVAELGEHPGINRVDVAGPGFINFHLDPAWIAAHVARQTEDPHHGIAQHGAGKTVVIDYSSPNVAKRMHIGHMRSTIIGNAFHRLYEACGWRVVADNHIGDWGTQFGKLIVSWHRDLDEANFDADPIGELERLYVDFGNQVEAEPTLGDAARAETAKLQAGDEANTALWRQFIDISLREFESVYKRLGVQFDVTLGESFYNDALSGVVDALLEAGIAIEDAGAVIIAFPEDHAVKAVRNRKLVIRKGDGAFLYGTTDLATLEYRLSEWAPREIVYVTDGRQQLHFTQVFEAWKSWRADRGLATESVALRHSWFGTLKLPHGSMSTRQGNVIRLVDLLDEAVTRARAVVDEKSSDFPESERAAIAEAMGIGSVRYADLSQNPQSDVIFDWDRMLSLDGNTAVFLLYSAARCFSILRRVEAEGVSVDLTAAAPSTNREKELVLALARFPEMVRIAQTSHRPNLLCDHLFETAQRLNRFYAAVRVFKKDGSVNTSALAIIALTARVLRSGLAILGIPVLERM
jgi:arginyl-tRNA synthetase